MKLLYPRSAVGALIVVASAITVSFPAVAATGNPSARAHKFLLSQAPSVRILDVNAGTLAMENSPQAQPLQTAELSAERSQASFQQVDFWYGNLNWSRYRHWASNWRNIAWNKISAVRSNWKQTVLKNGFKAVLSGASGAYVTNYYRSKGLYCPNPPWWLPGHLAAPWAVLTCAESAR